MAEYRRNAVVFIVLIVLTILELVVAINLARPGVPLILIALIKAGLIVNYFMHVYRLWRPEEHK
jgi:caa(3)-type oxidase subunit IV